ncbi:hypothetical protein [Caudoviricetes sp.]|nr:hypothetical protein [Caudoviricetes sp.]
MNTNLFHNILNVVIALLAAITAFLIASGCTTLSTGVLECSQSWISPGLTTTIIAVLAFLKTMVNIFRDGIGGLIKPQPSIRR